MDWLNKLDTRLVTFLTRPSVGILLLAAAAAVTISIPNPGWKPPAAVVLLILGAGAIAMPLVRLWREKEGARPDDQPVSWLIPISILVGFLILAFYNEHGGELRHKVIGLLFVAGAAAVIGMLVGFLFGIPRVAAKQVTAEVSDETAATHLETNTNLEAISDWLTKIIVGVTLVQARVIVDRFDDLVNNLAVGFPRPLVGGTLLFFLVTGFLYGYLYTRLVLTRYFSASERALRQTPEYYEGLMNAFLYQPKPQSFRKVTALFEQYTKRFGEPRHSRIWVYLAAAYGQQYTWMRTVETKPPESPELQPIIEKVVRAIRSAVASDKSALALLTGLAAEGYDEDLLMIANESSEVRKALGME